MHTNLRGYGDIDNVKTDVRALRDIISRQGHNFVMDVIAEGIGETVNKFKLGIDDVKRLKTRLLDELRDAINERT